MQEMEVTKILFPSPTILKYVSSPLPFCSKDLNTYSYTPLLPQKCTIYEI